MVADPNRCIVHAVASMVAMRFLVRSLSCCTRRRAKPALFSNKHMQVTQFNIAMCASTRTCAPHPPSLTTARVTRKYSIASHGQGAPSLRRS